MDQQGDSPSATANHAPQPPPRLTVVPAAKAEANGGSTSGIRGSFDERVLSGSQASSGRGLLQDRVSEDSERREGEMRGNTSPVRAERRGGLGLMLEGDKITKIIAGSKCHRAGLKVRPRPWFARMRKCENAKRASGGDVWGVYVAGWRRRAQGKRGAGAQERREQQAEEGAARGEQWHGIFRPGAAVCLCQLRN
eukprot:2913744-Rhodomonas_salina.2